jgi:hypothetical protein
VLCVKCITIATSFACIDLDQLAHSDVTINKRHCLTGTSARPPAMMACKFGRRLVQAGFARHQQAQPAVLRQH